MRRVLVLEDSPFWLNQLVRSLEAAGVSVLAPQEEEFCEASETVAVRHVDWLDGSLAAAFIDLGLSELCTGPGLVEAWRALGRKLPPLVFMTIDPPTAAQRDEAALLGGTIVAKSEVTDWPGLVP